MRKAFLSMPSEEELRTRPVYALVRDYPELLPPLRVRVRKLEGAAASPLSGLFSGDGDWLPELLSHVAWRGNQEGSVGGDRRAPGG